jgi:hypothetical protein
MAKAGSENWWGNRTDRDAARRNFQRRVTPEPNTGCWLWTGGVDKDGYGKFQVSVGYRSQVHLRAHRFAWEDVHGPLPAGMLLLHSCDTPSCANEGHVRPGSQLENIRDATGRGRRATGDRHSNAKLRAVDVWSMRRKHAKGWSFVALAEAYGVSKPCVWLAVVRRNWRHVP